MSEDDLDGGRYGFCPTCGMRAVAGFSFCGACGRSLLRAVGSTPVVEAQPTEPALSTESASHRTPSPSSGTPVQSPITEATSASDDTTPRSARGRMWAIGTVLALIAIAAGVVFGVPAVRNDLFGSAKTSDRASIPPSSTSTTVPALSSTLQAYFAPPAPAALETAILQSFDLLPPQSASAGNHVELDAGSIVVTDDPVNKNWVWMDVSPSNADSLAEFWQDANGHWTVYKGSGTSCDGQPSPAPAQVLKDFKADSCGYVAPASTTTTAPLPVSQVTPEEAYQTGFSRGEHLEFPSSFSLAAAANAAAADCRTNEYSDAELNAQYDDGCVAGFNGQSSSRSSNVGPTGENNGSGAPASGSGNVGPSGENNDSGAPSNGGAMPSNGG